VYVRVSFPGTATSLVRHEAWAMGQARAAGVPVPEVLDLRSIETGDGARTAMVMRAADGRQLGQLLPDLSPVQRRAAMVDIGRTLGILNAVATPGAWEPEGEGRWADAEAHRRRYLANVRSDTQHLPAAGLDAAEVERVVALLASGPVDPSLVLCHGDVSPEHVFVDDELRVVGLIDFGQWYAGSPASELAGVAMRTTEADIEAVVAGHPQGEAARAAVGWHVVAQATGQIRWLVTSGQAHELEAPVARLRTALPTIAGPECAVGETP
jgi:aminoglycoside phosphotransferase (APT) family kinase protein